MKRLAPILTLAFAGCIATNSDDFEKLQAGHWVEAKGRMVDGQPVVDEVDEVPRSESDKADKLEITAATTRATPNELEVIGRTLKTDAETEYENADKKPIAAFVPELGEWVRLKLRRKDDDFKVRTVRQSEQREQWKVTGEILAVDAQNSRIDVGGIQLPVAANAAIAMIGERNADDPLALFQADDQKGVPFSIVVNDNLRLGGGVSIGADLKDEYDLDQTNTRDQKSTDGQLKFDALWLFDDKASYAMFEFEGGRSDTYRDGSADTYSESLQVTRAVASVALTSNLQLLAGRQDFDEEREWLYDEVLDGLRLVMLAGQWQFEAAAAQGREVLAENNSTEDTQLLLGMARYRLTPDWTLGGYVLKRSDQTVRDHEPLLFGLRSIDTPRYGLGHWAELGFARGHSRWSINDGGPLGDEVAARTEDIEGWAFDVGAIYTFDAALRPALSLGYAYGSGERDSSNHQGYRQTGYNDNNGKLGGVTSVRYYGEMLRPELANLAVFTCGAAIRPWSGASLSALFHTYTQDFAAQGGPLTDLRIGSSSAPTGVDPDLGREFDLVFGYRAARQLTLEIIAARFEPGDAFVGQDAAHKLDFTARISF